MKRRTVNTYIGMLAVTVVGATATWMLVQLIVVADVFGGYAAQAEYVDVVAPVRANR